MGVMFAFFLSSGTSLHGGDLSKVIRVRPSGDTSQLPQFPEMHPTWPRALVTCVFPVCCAVPEPI